MKTLLITMLLISMLYLAKTFIGFAKESKKPIYIIIAIGYILTMISIITTIIINN